MDGAVRHWRRLATRANLCRSPSLPTLTALVLMGGCNRSPSTQVRIATYNASLYGDRSGAMAAAIRSGDARARAAAEVLVDANPDIVLINEIDPDAVDPWLDAAVESPYPHRFVPPSNTGVLSGFDLDRDGATTGPADALGFGHYAGQYGMALLSRWPIERTTCFGARRWASFPWAVLPDDPNTPQPGDYYPASVLEVLPLSSKNHCDVVVSTPAGALHLLISHPTPPVFDGPEDRNGHRNRDEIAFWIHYIDELPSDARFVVLGDLNADPHDGEASASILPLIRHPRIRDVEPRSVGAAAAARRQHDVNVHHVGDPAMDTADFDDTSVGNLRVDYVLPSRTLAVGGAGVHWPEAPAPEPSDHHLVWVDVSSR